MFFFRRYGVIGLVLVGIMFFTIPAFADWQKVPIKSVTFRETIPKSAIGADERGVYVATSDGYRLIVYRYSGNKVDKIWLVDGSLAAKSKINYPSMFEYRYGGNKYLGVSYICGNELKAALLDPSSESWRVYTVFSELNSPAYTSASAGHAIGINADVVAIVVGGGNGVYLALWKIGPIDSFKNPNNWSNIHITSDQAIGVDVIVSPNESALGNFKGLIFISYIAKGNLYLAVSNGSDKKKMFLVKEDVGSGGNTSLGGAIGTNEVALSMAYVTASGKLYFGAFVTKVSEDIFKMDSLNFKTCSVVENVDPRNIEMEIVKGSVEDALVALTYIGCGNNDNIGTMLAYKENVNLKTFSSIDWGFESFDPEGIGAITFLSGTKDGDLPFVFLSWVDISDNLKLVYASPQEETRKTIFARASIFGIGLSVVKDSQNNYHASFYDAPLGTLGYLKIDSNYNVIADATTLITNNYGWFKKAGDAVEVNVDCYLDAGWNTDLTLDSNSNPHIVFTSSLETLGSNEYRPAKVSYVTTVSGGWSTPFDVSGDKGRNVRDLDIELLSGDGSEICVAWVSAEESKGIFYRIKAGSSWGSVEEVSDVFSSLIIGNIDMKAFLSGSNRLVGLAMGIVDEDEEVSISYAWMDLNSNVKNLVGVERFDGSILPGVALTLYGSEATIVYTKLENGLFYKRFNMSSGSSESGSIDVATSCDPSAIVDSSGVYLLYKFYEGDALYYRFGVVGDKIEDVIVDGKKVSTIRAFERASRVETLVSKELFFCKDKDAGRFYAITAGEVPVGEINISVSSLSLDFGEVEVNDSKKLVLFVTVDNTTINDVSVSVSVSGGGFSANPTSWTVPARETVEKSLEVTFTPTEAKTYSGSIEIKANGVTKTVALSGTGKSGKAAGCSTSGVGSLGLVLLAFAPMLLIFKKKVV